MTRITRAQVIDDLAKIVAEYGPDTIYRDRDEEYASSSVDSCRYFDPHTNEPLCIVGVWLDRRGIDRERFLGPSNEDAFATLIEGGILPEFAFDDDARAALCAAQSTQDTGGTWGDALINARNGS